MARTDVVQVLKDALAGEFRMLFAADVGRHPIGLCSAPGRLDVLGGLEAQVGGTVAQMALPARAAVAVQWRDEPELVIQSGQIGRATGSNPVRIALPSHGNNAWAEPVAAMWRVLADAFPGAPQGAVIAIHSAIPMGAGQASSTALLAALALGVHRLRGKAAGAAEIAELVRQAEELSGHSGQGGEAAVMDATTLLLADVPLASGRGGLLRYSSQPCELVGQVPLPENLRILAMDTGVRRRVGAAGAGGESAEAAENVLEELRIAGAMGLAIIETIYRDLGQVHTPLHGYLANTSPLLYRQYFRALLPRRLRGSDFIRTYGPLPGDQRLDPAAIYRVRTAVDHLIAENEHAEQFLQAMEELSERTADGLPAMTDPEERQRTQQRAGRLALASHHSYRLRLELSCPEADWLVDRLMEAGPERGIYGGRITGAGGGGTVMALVERSPEAGEAVLEIMQAYARTIGLALSIVEAGGAGSAGALLSNPPGTE